MRLQCLPCFLLLTVSVLGCAAQPVPEPRAAAVASSRKALAEHAFARMVDGLHAWDDERALANGERLFQLYPTEAARIPQANRVLNDLKRRKQQGKFGREPTKELPAKFAEWSNEKQLLFLVDALEDLDYRPVIDRSGARTRTPIEDDFRLHALIKLGEAVVPALLDVADHDERLTRFADEFFRGKQDTPHVVSVREAVLAVFPSLLRVSCLDPRDPWKATTDLSDDALKKQAAVVRAYWKEFGQLPFDERMMKMLTDGRSHSRALHEAVANLVNPDRQFARPPRTGYYYVPSPRPVVDHPAVKQFKSPTAAEAILSLLDREDQGSYEWDSDCLFYLTVLGDKRIVPELARRAGQTADFRLRRQYAHYCNLLGQREPMKALTEDIRTGKSFAPTRLEFEACVATLTRMRMPEADRTLVALSDSKHPHHELVRKRLLTYDAIQDIESPIYGHPYCVTILRNALDDLKETGAVLRIAPLNLVERRTAGTGASIRRPKLLEDAAMAHEKVVERGCDFAGLIVARRMAGVPDFHGLARDADERIAKMKQTLDQFHGKWRLLTEKESRHLTSSDEGHYTLSMAPRVTPLGRAATAEDVKSGQAVFHLQRKTKPIDLKLPAIGFPKKDDPNRGVLIVQAEVDVDGLITYGIIERHAIRAASAREFEKITPVEALSEDR